MDVPVAWAGGIDDLVGEANAWLARLLPEDRAQRPKDAVNPRLVRHYTTQGLLPAALREGRDARYTRLHLFALLALRRLMADGLSGKALYAALHGKTEDELGTLAVQGSPVVGALSRQEEPAPHSDDALAYLQRLKAKAPREDGSPPLLFSAPAPEIRAEAFPRKSAKAKRRATQKLYRTELRPGLEVLVGEHFRLPVTEEGWERLLRDFRQTLLSEGE